MYYGIGKQCRVNFCQFGCQAEFIRLSHLKVRTHFDETLHNKWQCSLRYKTATLRQIVGRSKNALQ